MNRNLSVAVENWPIHGSFRISRGAKTQATVVVCTLKAEGATGRGECVPYPRYGETPDSVREQIAKITDRIESGESHEEILAAMQHGAARNAVDCALWDLEAKLSGKPVHRLVCDAPPRPVDTAMTISLDNPEEMARQARTHTHRKLIKAKMGGKGDAERIHAIAAAAPNSRIILDANESWTPEETPALLQEAARAGIVLIEQPLPADNDEMLARIPHPVPICADESVHTSEDLADLAARYDYVNIKLDKAGGLTEALRMRQMAHEIGFSVMVGCMVATSLSMAPAILLAQQAEIADLDGPLLLERDRDHGVNYSSSIVSPAREELWG